MSTLQPKSHCGTCIHNVNNYCTSLLGYYFYGEAISSEEVDCQDWVQNKNSYGELLKLPKKSSKK